MPPKRKSYFANYKLQVAKYVAENNNRAAERKFGVSEKLVTPGRAQCNFPGSHWMDGQSLDFRDTETILSGFRKTRIILTGTDAESDDTEEKVALNLPPEVVELLRSDTEDEELNGFSDLE
ncbi:hypothetical protein NL108_013990 [Boleophthalmus pectinirostris]|nr:hypothetical protein NL108_013990 [Boleophthalmus pectinirostris]